MLSLKTFICKETRRNIYIPICQSCSSNLESLESLQTISVLTSKLCSHSRIATQIIQDFNCPSNLDNWLRLSEDEDEKGNRLEFLNKRTCTSTKSQHLAVVFLKDKKPSLLYTMGRQLTPRCSSCSHPRCGCVHYFEKVLKSESSNINSNINENVDDEDDDVIKLDHYNKRVYGVYGYNTEPIIIPLKSCPIQKTIYDKRDARFCLPDSLVPDFLPDMKCKHHNSFSQNRYRLITNTAIIYNDQGETIVPCQIFSRKSDGGCKCEQQISGHEYLLFYCGMGKFWDYVTMQKFTFTYAKDGLSSLGFYKSIKASFEANENQIFSCDYQTFLKCCDGFVTNIKWDLKSIFTCPNCGISPKFFTGDGTSIAPLQRKMKGLNIKEISSHPDDKSSLQQGSNHRDRVFLSDPKERSQVSSFLTNKDVEIKKFLSTSTSNKSEEFMIIFNIIKKFESCDSLPDPYIKLLSEATKNIATAGILQVRNRGVLKILREFCLKQVNIRAVENEHLLSQIRAELPAIWPLILSILNYENSTFLPIPVNRLILSLLKKRNQTFRNATVRFSDDYFKYEQNEEPASSFYPNHPLIFHPKLYNINGHTDTDGCSKNFSTHTDFLDGIFSIGKISKHLMLRSFKIFFLLFQVAVVS